MSGVHGHSRRGLRYVGQVIATVGLVSIVVELKLVDRLALSVCTNGGAPVTSTVCELAPTANFTLATVDWPTLTVN